MKTATVLRHGLGAAGLLLIGIGARQVAVLPDPVDVLVWLGGAIVLHDGLIAPLVLAVGLFLPARPARGVLRGALLTAGCLVLVTSPLMLRPEGRANPTVLPLAYGRNLALVLAAVAAVTGLVLLAGWLRRSHPAGFRDSRQSSAPPQDGGGG
ncbi:hypothetical protein ACFWBF_01270 [Streptomyces sp. NPDC060028]|uniref:hypothetical protein n=1 Tax=Streptomyces sp. NPDC060028 TaxID=3347041 RepID=UPI0036882702